MALDLDMLLKGLNIDNGTARIDDNEDEHNPNAVPSGAMTPALPNGGLEGQALLDNIAKNRGGIATTGFNPNTMETDPALQANGPSLFSRVSGQIQNQVAKGNLPAPPAARLPSSAPVPAKSTDDDEDSGNQPQAPFTPGKDLYGKDLNDGALKDAQSEAARQNFIANLMRAGNLGAAAVSRGHDKAHNEVADAIAGNSQQGVKDIQTRRDAMDKDLTREKSLLDLGDESALRDPTSPISTALREGANMLGLAVGDNTSGKQLRDSGISLGSLLQVKEMADARRDIAAQNAANRKDAQKDKEERRLDDLGLKFGEQLNANKARAGTMGKASARVLAADSVQALLDQYPDNNIPAAQTMELATGVAALVSNGSPQSIHQIQSILPHSLHGDISKLQSYMSGNPTGAGQQAFIKQLRDTVARERNVATDFLRQAQVEQIPAFESIYKKHGQAGMDAMNAILAGKGITPEVRAKFEHSGQAATPPAPRGKVKVSNGTENLYIDPTDLEHAQADGFKQVK